MISKRHKDIPTHMGVYYFEPLHMPDRNRITHQLRAGQEVLIATLGGGEVIPLVWLNIEMAEVEEETEEEILDFRWPMPSHLSYIRREPLCNSLGVIFAVEPDDRVESGQIIAISGDTGSPGQFHLHLDIFVDDTSDNAARMNPLPWFHWDDRRQ